MAKRRQANGGDTPLDALVRRVLGRERSLRIGGLRGATRALVTARLAEAHGDRPLLVLVPDWKAADSFADDLRAHIGEAESGGRVRTFPHHDVHPYYARVGDRWTNIDFSKPASAWMKPLVRGQETDLIEIPGNWYLDDLPPMMFIKAAPNSHGFVNPRHLEEIWRDQFDWVYREHDYAVFTMTIHPDVSGRPQVLLMLERLYAYMIHHPGVQFRTFEEIADDFARRRPRAG